MKEKGRDDSKVSITEVVRQRLRRLRAQRQLTQEDLCERAGISVDAVSRIENGNRTPTLETLQRLSRALGVRVVDLVGTGDLPRISHSPSIQRIISLLEPQSLSTHESAEKLIRVLIQSSTDQNISEAHLAAEDKKKYGRRKKKR